MTEFSQLVSWNKAASLIGSPPEAFETHGTTVIALRYDKGIAILADRRATAGNLIMYDHAEKVVALDDSMVVAISGAYAKSIDVCRFLKHSFSYYRRTVLAEMSTEGKLVEISKALAGNAPMAMQGIGLFLPIVASYDKKRDAFGVFFFDGAGARFQNGSYACAGSGSERIRGVFEYIARTKGPWESRSLNTVLRDGLEMLDIAADLDSATGGFNKTLPIVWLLDRDGNSQLETTGLQKLVTDVLQARR